MCGIVAYFGGAGNPLTRILTGMSAIIYRAPDSTGIGLFGDDREPIRMRKALGSVVRLLGILQADAVYVRPEAVMTRLLTPHGGAQDLESRQQALLAFEGFETLPENERPAPPEFDSLVDPAPLHPVRLVPGVSGKALFQAEYRVRSRKDLSSLIQFLINTFDLSPLVIHTLIRGALAETIARRRSGDAVGAAEADILAAFDDLFEATRFGARFKQLRRQAPPGPAKPSSARKALWQNLVETVIQIPADYNRDGVCCLFRLLDACLLSRMAGDPTLGETLDRTLDAMWLPTQRPQRVDWRTLYAVEKGLNVYGWAGAAALAHLQRDVFFPAATGEMSQPALMTAESMVPGQTDPHLLRFLATPIIAHGRWAMQSAVTVENAHPFPDARLQRALALNGQFDSRVETRLQTFLETVAGYHLRSGNSAEYVALLWGHFYDRLRYEQRHSDVVRRQVENEMTDIAIGSQSIDYHVVHRVRDRTAAELDQMAFIAAARQIVKDGGQIAAVGISLASPRTVFLASHNRPVFVVRRLANDDFMVVSDINAALGLFPQNLIEASITALDALEKRRRETMAAKTREGADPSDLRTARAAFAEERNQLLEPFAVEVHPLDGEELFALVAATIEGGRVRRRVTLSDFDGTPLPELEPFETRLDPVTVRKDVDRSFHETHLREVPERFRHILTVYSPESPGAAPAVDLRTRALRRRFGRRLEGLRRLILVGTGSTLHMAEIVRPYLRRVLPETAVDVLRPGDIEDPRRRILPQQDLVIMLSWSSTTAEMVQLAQQLAAERILMAGITEKRFADMALAAEKSAGVMPIYSGEEVTIAGIKSTLCLLLCLDVLGLWMAAQKGLLEKIAPAFRDLEKLADRIERITADPEALAFSRQTAAAMTGADAIIVVTAPEAYGIGKEVALKLEEASWYSVGQCYTYEDVLEADPERWPPDRFVLVHATQRAHMEAVAAVVEKLAAAGIRLAVVTCANRHQEQIDAISGRRCLVLPREDDHRQIYIDLAFYYRMALDLGLACGHGPGEAPRNRTKSPTVTRSRSKLRQSPAAEVKHLAAGLPAASPASRSALKHPSSWETVLADADAAKALAHLRGLAEGWQQDALAGVSDHDEADPGGGLGHFLFDRRSEVNELVMVSLDPLARAAVGDVAAFWRRLIGLSIRELPAGEWPHGVRDDVLVMAVAARSGSVPPGGRPLLQAAEARIAWIGPPPTARLVDGKGASSPSVLTSVHQGDPAAQVYCGLHSVFLKAWQDHDAKKAAVVARHAAEAVPVVDAVLQDEGLLTGLRSVAAAHAGYRTAFFISPFTTSGRTWEVHFDRSGCLTLVHHSPGQTGHGPIVTVDGAVDQKYVALESRDQMVSRYGTADVARWEAAFLGGQSIDTFLSHLPAGPLLYPRAPFYSRNRWYLPVLQPGYDTRRDNLIVLDMTGQRALPLMLDELSLLGSRAPRLVIITQEARLREVGEKTFFSFPVCDLLVLPTSNGMPIADLHLPLALNALGAALAAVWEERRASGTPGR